MSFNVGDRVLYTTDKASYEGTIVKKDTQVLNVEFDREIPGGHTCNSTCARNRGLWFHCSTNLLRLLGHDVLVKNFGDFVRAQDRRTDKSSNQAKARSSACNSI